MNEEIKRKIFIVPHTHWDREWYEPFQIFRHKLVNLIDFLLEILKNQQDFRFTFDGQTVVLEDYLEVRPERKDELLKRIQEKKIVVGPWYLLPDEWLVGQESILRNLEFSFDLAQKFNIPLMQVGYLPDQFGHSRAIPEILADLTSIRTAVIWRGVGPEISTTLFNWKSHNVSSSSILTIYLPFGYGNAAILPDVLEMFQSHINILINDLEPFSHLPYYLLMNGTDHQFPSASLSSLIKQTKIKNAEISLTTLDTFVKNVTKAIKSSNFHLPEYCGEFRSSARAPLLQDTYSSRMWIKLWNQKIEDLLVHYAEPLSVYALLLTDTPYPSSFLSLAWKWFLRNHPHDSICGCSIDKTNEEMKARFSWSESLASTLIQEAISKIKKDFIEDEPSSLVVFNPTNCSTMPIYFEFSTSIKKEVKSIQNNEGKIFPIQKLSSKEDVIFDDVLSPLILNSGLKLLPGRKLMDDYINEVMISEDIDNQICSITVLCGKEPVGDFNIEELKEKGRELIQSKKFKKFKVKATRGTEQYYAALAPLSPWSLNTFTLLEKREERKEEVDFIFSKNFVENKFYRLSFNKDGSLKIFSKELEQTFSYLHFFEDFGDRGDEYTFGKVEPEKTSPKVLSRKILSSGPLFVDIEEKLELRLFKELNKNRDKRIGKVKVPVSSIFRFYKDSPRIDITTTYTNLTKDHRLRICFDLPYKSKETITSTHFGHIKRRSDPFNYETFEEQPSGIQAQKRFIRIEDPSSTAAFTLINDGLPEVELKNNSHLALTVLRCVGYLSRSDFPERPIHAGPFLETPGAQEQYKGYTFKYSFVIHKKEEPLEFSYYHSEIFTLSTQSFRIKENTTLTTFPPLISFDNTKVLISSMRERKGKVLITAYNIDETEVKTMVSFHKKVKAFSEIQLDEKEKKPKQKITNNKVELTFKPLEIKILCLEKN
ncbi:MAG: glycoside hydrolase family 38 C-terminal domain-containing protein [Candidatus Heimdallarchaeaceae archaeon]